MNFQNSLHHPAESPREASDWRTTLSTACLLDRQADFELAHGHHARAELLAEQAFALREAGR